ncbi:hypothetical protein NL676_006746 [Syzygium grande]|nr:hypothetical protein NL676_006746 [Syzygium grande]
MMDPPPRQCTVTAAHAHCRRYVLARYISLALSKPERKAKAEPERERERERAKMSWQAYVDDHLMCDVDGQHLAAAAIVGHDGSVWARSSAFPQFKPEEIAAILKGFR